MPIQEEGPYGHCYAIPLSVSMEKNSEAIARFLRYAGRHKELQFFVSDFSKMTKEIPAQDLALSFSDGVTMENILLPMKFWDELGIGF